LVLIAVKFLRGKISFKMRQIIFTTYAFIFVNISKLEKLTRFTILLDNKCI